MASSTTDRRLGLVGNTAVKAPVACVATTPIMLSGEQAIDGVTTSQSRVLVTAQADATTNGIYDSSSASWTRSVDADGTYDLVSGSMVTIAGGAHAYQVWILASADPISIGTSALSWSMNASATFLATLAASGGSNLVGFLQGGTGAVGRTTQAKLRDAYVTLEDFGGVADWNGATGTDNQPAIALAMAALPALGGVIKLGRGRYKTSAFSTAGFQHITFVGEGNSEAANDTGATELILTTGTIVVASPHCTFERLVIRGAVGHAGDALQVAEKHFNAHRLSVYSAGQNGLRIGTDLGTANQNTGCLVNCCFSSNGNHGIYVNDGTTSSVDCNAWTVLHCVANLNGGDGVRLGNAIETTILGGVFENNAGCGCRMVSGATNNMIKGGDYEQNSGTNEISVETGALFNAIDVTLTFASVSVASGTFTYVRAIDAEKGAGWKELGINRLFMDDNGGANDIVSGATNELRLFQGADVQVDANSQLTVGLNGASLGKSGGKLSFFQSTSGTTQPVITGSRGGNAALTSLLSLGSTSGLNLWKDTTTT